MQNKRVSIVIPIYNEQNSIADCLESLKLQSYKPIEIILIDDGSKDQTGKIIRDFKSKNKNTDLVLVSQTHKGPGVARNLGAEMATGQILVFVDADMTFEKDFMADLIAPILKGKSIGTFSKNEFVKNQENIWSVAWNINRNCPADRMLPADYPDYAPVFRAILKNAFDKVNGFSTTGEYTDDWSLSRKLKIKSSLASGAVYFHSNPQNQKEVWNQARWIGRSEFISGTILRKVKSLIFYSIPFSICIGIYKSIATSNFFFMYFKLIYDFAVWVSTIESLYSDAKAK